MGTSAAAVWGHCFPGAPSRGHLVTPGELACGWGRLCGGRHRSLNQTSVPDAKGLSNPSEVETLREKVYATLEAYTKQKYPDQPGR